MNTNNFKSILMVLALIFMVRTSNAGNHKQIDSSKAQVCLEILGIAMDAYNKPLDGAQVKLYKENDELEWTEVTSVFYHEHSFMFKLDANEYYTIEISKPGYVTRIVGVSTAVPSTISLKQMFRYEFEVQLFKEKKGVDDYYMDFPVAIISYDTKNDVFDNNNAYTKHIKTKINEAVSEANIMNLQQKK